MASTHHPAVGATYALSTAIRNASTSMSKRAPSADSVPVRRATRPSAPSRTRPIVARATKAGTASAPTYDCAVSPATPHASTARVAVIRPAGPRPAQRCRASAPARRTAVPAPLTSPAVQPTGPRPTTTSKTTSSAAAPAPTNAVPM